MTVPKTFAAYRAACEPTLPLEACAICTKIPTYCMRFEKGGDLESDNIPPEAAQLVTLLGHVQGCRGEIKRCPTCHRMYWYDSEYEFLVGGSEDTWQYERKELDELFRSEWFIRYRLVPQDVRDTEPQLFFRQHSLARLEAGWIALHDEGATMPIASLADIARLAAIDPPADLDQPERAMKYAAIVDRVTSSEHFSVVTWFGGIDWRYTLTDDERAQIEDLRAASRVDKEQAEKLADRVVITCWVVSQRRLICRVLSVFPNGEVRREDAVIGENLPIY